MKKNYLLTPGPTIIPGEVIDAMARPIIHHRTPEYKKVTASVNENLKKIFKTSQNVLTFTASGTGAMEASVSNTMQKGDTAIVVRGGKFGERFEEICRAYGVNVIPIDVEWGTRPDPKEVESKLKGNPAVKAVFLQLCETSTATAYDIQPLGDIVAKTDAILVVDGISGLGADTFSMDDWNVDITIGGSQKAFMIPPGLSFCAVSKKAWEMVKKSDLPKYYYNFQKYDKLIEKSDTPWTPAISLMIGLDKALSMIVDEGVDNFVKRHQDDAEYARKSLKDMGLEIFSKFPSNAVTAVSVPEGIDGGKLIKSMKAKDVTFAGGQGHLKGKIFRFAHMGGITKADLKFALDRLKETLKEEDIKA